MPFIEVKAVSKAYRERLCLRSVSFSLERGERVTLLGPSGCGKSTLLRILCGLLAPDTGRILIDDETVSLDGRVLSEPERRNIGMVFQNLALWPHLTVAGNLTFGLKARHVRRQQAEERIRSMLRLMELESGSLESCPAENSNAWRLLALSSWSLVFC
jgi:ABC-type sugar transport system ATPase subunit